MVLYEDMEITHTLVLSADASLELTTTALRELAERLDRYAGPGTMFLQNLPEGSEVRGPGKLVAFAPTLRAVAQELATLDGAPTFVHAEGTFVISRDKDTGAVLLSRRGKLLAEISEKDADTLDAGEWGPVLFHTLGCGEDVREHEIARAIVFAHRHEGIMPADWVWTSHTDRQVREALRLLAEVGVTPAHVSDYIAQNA